eukprot:gene13317-13446_t
MSAINVKPEFGLVVGTAAASYLVYNVEYPALYADEKNCPNEAHRMKFNCTQRAHLNSLENISIFHTLLLTSGLKYPITAASFGALYLAGRIGYVEGYSSGDPKKRINYVTGLTYVGILGLLGTTIKFAYDLLQSK